jgi:hypothetical protein
MVSGEAAAVRCLEHQAPRLPRGSWLTLIGIRLHNLLFVYCIMLEIRTYFNQEDNNMEDDGACHYRR